MSVRVAPVEKPVRPISNEDIPGVQVSMVQCCRVWHSGQLTAACLEFREQRADGRAFFGAESIGAPDTQRGLVGQELSEQLGKGSKSAVRNPECQPAWHLEA